MFLVCDGSGCGIILYLGVMATHKPMDDEEMLYQQVQMTTAETPGSTVWVYRCSVYAYPCVARACVEVRNVCCNSTFAPAAGTQACARF